MALRPGRRFEISSHFIPLPLSSIIRASSSVDHLLCFLTGGSDALGSMPRRPPDIETGAVTVATRAGIPPGESGVGRRGTEANRYFRDATKTEAASDPDALTRDAISTVTAVVVVVVNGGYGPRCAWMIARSTPESVFRSVEVCREYDSAC